MMLLLKIGQRVPAALLCWNNSTALQKAAVGLRVGGEAFACSHGKHVSII